MSKCCRWQAFTLATLISIKCPIWKSTFKPGVFFPLFCTEAVMKSMSSHEIITTLILYKYSSNCFAIIFFGAKLQKNLYGKLKKILSILGRKGDKEKFTVRRVLFLSVHPLLATPPDLPTPAECGHTSITLLLPLGSGRLLGSQCWLLPLGFSASHHGTKPSSCLGSVKRSLGP